MPTVRRIGPYRLHFYSSEFNEPPHIHISRDDLEAKFWLEPVSLAANFGFEPKEVNTLRKLTERYCQSLLRAYIDFHAR